MAWDVEYRRAGSAALALSLLSWGFAAPAEAGRASLPDRPVIETVGTGSAATGASGGASHFGMSATDLARQDIVQSDDAATSAEVNKLMGVLRSNSPTPNAPISVHIISDPRPNAHTLDGGNIVVNDGLLRALRTREEKNDALAFILAHEYGHSLFNDPASQVEHAKSLEGVGDSVSLAAQLAGASRYGAGAASGCGAPSQSPLNALAGQAMTGDWLKSELYRASYGPFSREAETRADFFAVDLLVKAKMNPVAGSRPIEDLFQSYDDTLRKRLEGQIKTVGTAMEGSMKQLGQCAPGLLQSAVYGGSMESQIKGYMTGQLIGWMNGMVKARGNKENVHLYYSADERVRAIRAYSDKFYPGQIADSSADLAAFGGTDAFSKFSNKEMTASAADQIVDLNAQGRFQEAMALVRQNEHTPAGQSMQFLVGAGTAAKGTGDTKQAITYFDAAAKKPEAIAVVYRQLAVLQLDDGQADKAIATLDRGEAKIKDPAQFIVTRITVYRGKGDTGKAMQLAQQCNGMGNPALAEQCNNAAGIEATSSTAKESGGGGFLDQLKQNVPSGGLPNLWH